MREPLTREKLEKVINNKKDFNLDVCYNMDNLQSTLKSLGWTSEDDYDTNGYQVGWWETWKKDDKILNLSGAFWYSFLGGRFSE